MKIQELVTGKNPGEKVRIAATELPVAALNKLLQKGYENIRAYTQEKTISVWGKALTACFTEKEIQKMV